MVNPNSSETTLEMHYDISGPEADRVELKVWRLARDGRMTRIHTEKGKADGYFESVFENGQDFEICFGSPGSYSEKDISFMLKQVTKNKVEFAKMNSVELMIDRLKGM